MVIFSFAFIFKLTFFLNCNVLTNFLRGTNILVFRLSVILLLIFLNTRQFLAPIHTAEL